MTTHYLGATMDFLASNLAYILIAIIVFARGENKVYNETIDHSEKVKTLYSSLD
jgi:hypothetical protein